MDKRIASPNFRNEALLRSVLKHVEDNEGNLDLGESIFYYDFPIFRDETNTLYRSHALIASRKRGLIIFGQLDRVDEGREAAYGRTDKSLSQLDSIIFGKLLRSKPLRAERRSLVLPITTAILDIDAEEVAEPGEDIESKIITSYKDLDEAIASIAAVDLADTQWEELISLLEGAKAIGSAEARDSRDLKEGSRAHAIANLEAKIKNFDLEQRRAALTVVDGPQRIRGIAGSGKTIVLAMKAAHLHLYKPEATILVTFWTKSLYDLIRQQITRFYRQFNDRDPDWEKLHVLHAWGGQSSEGVYFNACVEQGFRPRAVRDITTSGNRSKFEVACAEVLKVVPIEQKYDYILIDEGQDLPPNFYRLCFELCKGGEIDRNIVWAYDELQTIMDVRVQDVNSTFGYINKNTPKMDLDRARDELSNGVLPHDIVLKRSYRNAPEVLVAAHAVGFGVYGDTVVQMLENKDHWEDLGYVVEDGECREGETVKIRRPLENSPLSLSEYVPADEIIQVCETDHIDKEVDWIVSDISKFLDEGLKPEDILIISLDDRHARAYFQRVSAKLIDRNIPVNNLQNTPYSIPKFFIEGHVTLSTIYKAKGNEASVVYVLGIDAVGVFLDDVKMRNRLFTAFTRSKGWLRLTGIGVSARRVFKEVEQAEKNYPYLTFNYPSMKEIATIQRDLSEKSSKLKELQLRLFELEEEGVTEDDVRRLLESMVQKKK